MNTLWIGLLEKRALSYLLMGALVGYGIFSILTMRLESSPEIQVPVALVTTVLPGASPEDIETLITNEIEDAVDSIEDIKKITSTSREGVSVVSVEFNAEANIDRSVQKVRDEVAKVRGNVPDDATEPSVTDFNFADQPVLIAALSSDLPVTEFKKFSDAVKNELEAVPGVARVTVTGVRGPEVAVVVRKRALEQYELSLGEVVTTIAQSNAAVPVGTIEQSRVEYTVGLQGRLEDPSEVASLPITTRKGVTLSLSDVAFVAPGVEDATSLSRVSEEGSPSQQAAVLTVFKQRGADITDITDAVNERLTRVGTLSEGARAYVSFDAGEQIRKDLGQLTRDGAFAVALVMLVLFATLGWREAVIAGLSIPLTMFVAFTALSETGNTINFITLFALILTIGILVDSAIVVTEAIHVNLNKGLDRFGAAKQAVLEYARPLTAGTLTTVAVFVPLFLISGITGEFIQGIPYTVIFVLLASIFVALGQTPLLASLTLKERSETTFELRQEAYATTLKDWYRVRLGRLLDTRRTKRRFVWALIVLFVAALTLPVTGLVKTTFFPGGDVDWLYVEIEAPQGTPLTDTDRHVRAVEEVLYAIADIESFTTTVGSGSSFNQNASAGARFASININLRKNRTLTSDQMLAYIKKETADYRGATIRVNAPDQGPPTGAPILVTLSGDNLDALKASALIVRDVLRGIPGTRDVTTSAEEDASEFSVSIKRREAAELGLSPLSVAQTLRTAIFGTEATTIRIGGEEIKVMVKLDLNPNFNAPRETTITDIDALRTIPLQTQSGTVLLGSVVDVRLASANDAIRHEEGKRIITVSSEVDSGAFASDISAAFATHMSERPLLPDGVSISLGGENEDVQRSFQDMFVALILGVLLILVVLVVEFNQFKNALIVLSVVPLSLIGILFGLLVTFQPVSFPTMLGFIALSGVLVNHAIILVDVFERLRREHPNMPLREVVIEGGAIRLRPILLTKLTSVVGLIPLLFAADLWRPIAVAMIFGLSFTGVLTLVLLPAMYLKWAKRLQIS